MQDDPGIARLEHEGFTLPIKKLDRFSGVRGFPGDLIGFAVSESSCRQTIAISYQFDAVQRGLVFGIGYITYKYVGNG